MKNFEKGPEAPKNLLERLKAEKPDWDVTFTAVEKLEDEAQMREFFGQYVEYLKEAVIENPEEVARKNIGYVVGYCDKETADKWMNALPGVSHPVLGREIPFYDGKRAYESEAEKEGKE